MGKYNADGGDLKYWNVKGLFVTHYKRFIMKPKTSL